MSAQEEVGRHCGGFDGKKQRYSSDLVKNLRIPSFTHEHLKNARM
jgi:hypothetical protein